MGPAAGKQPAPVNPSSPPPQSFTPYSQQQQQQQQQPPPQNAAAPYAQAPSQQRPQSTYGAQELATSVYDSPIAPHNPSSAPFGQQQYHSYNPHEQAPPPAPVGQAPPPPSSLSPAPLQAGGGAYDARHGLPSQGGSGESHPPQPQYKPYVPPGDVPSPNDYYRQGGNPY
jgi:signal transducing adaptor molecule